jgi:LTXXQ motif family protein
MFANRYRMPIAAIAVAAALAGPALAEDDDSTGWWPRWGMGRMMDDWGMRGPMAGFMAEGMVERVEGRLAFLKTELKITGAQSAAWDELATVVKANAETHNAMMRTMMDEMRDGSFAKKPLPDRLVYEQTHLEARVEQIKTLKAAVDKLYAVLDDAQKKAADEIALPAMGMGMGMMMGPETGGRMMMR